MPISWSNPNCEISKDVCIINVFFLSQHSVSVVFSVEVQIVLLCKSAVVKHRLKAKKS